MGWRDDIFCKHHPDTMHHRWCWDKGGYCIDCGKTTEQMQTLGYTITVGPGGAAIIEKTDPDAKAPGMRGVVVDVSTPEGLAELRRWGQQYADVTKEQVLPLLKQATPEERVAKLAYEHMRSKFLAAEVPECSWENQNEAVRRDWIGMARAMLMEERQACWGEADEFVRAYQSMIECANQNGQTDVATRHRMRLAVATNIRDAIAARSFPPQLT